MAVLTEDALADHLAKLDPEKLNEIVARAQVLAQPTSKQDIDSEMLWKEIRDVLSDHGVKTAPLSVMASKETGRAYKANCGPFCAFIREQFRPKDRLEMIAIVRRVLNLTAKDLSSAGCGLSMKTIVRTLKDPQLVVDRHYPGWKDAGLLHMLARKAS